MYWICWHSRRVPTSPAPARSVLEISAGGRGSVAHVWLHYLHSFDAEKSKLSAYAIGFTRSALLMVKEGKELELKAFGDPGGFVPTR